MLGVSRVVALLVAGSLLSLPVLGAEEKDKKAPPAKPEVKKPEVKKEEPARKDAKKEEAPKKEAAPQPPLPKLPPPRKGMFKGHESDPDAAARNMMKKSSIPATVMAIVEDKKSLRLKLTIPYVRVNQGQLQAYANAQQQLLQANSPQALVNAQNSMAQAAAKLYELASVEKEVEWSATDDVKVRMKYPPPTFDEKGRVKRYTAKELKELKGNDKLPGYPAEFSDIKTGQIVTVTLQQKAGRPVKRGKDEADLGDDAPKIAFVVIVAEPKQ